MTVRYCYYTDIQKQRVKSLEDQGFKVIPHPKNLEFLKSNKILLRYKYNSNRGVKYGFYSVKEDGSIRSVVPGKE